MPILSDTTEDLPEIYDCCLGMLVIVLVLTGLGSLAGGGMGETGILQLIGFILSLGFILVIVILYRIEKLLRTSLQARSGVTDIEDV